MVTASEMGKKGGQAKSEAKASAARKNASKPRGRWVTAIAYEVAGVGPHNAFGSVITRGAPPKGAAACNEWLSVKVLEEGVGLMDAEHIEFLQLSSTSMRV